MIKVDLKQFQIDFYIWNTKQHNLSFSPVEVLDNDVVQDLMFKSFSLIEQRRKANS